MRFISRYPWLTGTTVAILAGASLFGCRDFLNSTAAPQGVLDQGILMTKSGVEGTLIAAYRQLDCTSTSGAWGCAASNWVWGSATSDDAYKGSEATDQPPIDQIEEFHWTTPESQGYLNDKWRAMYEGVTRSNATLKLLKQVQAANPSAIPATDAAGIRGEAIFLRAHYHFEAWRMWGNIPYYREDDTDFRKANETKAQVTADLIKDLDEAISLLGTTPRNGQKGRVTKWTAKAYKGRVQMYAGDFPAALTTLRDVQSNGPYSLELSYDRIWTGYKDLENGPETILAYQASANDGDPNGQNANWGNRLNFPHSGSPFGCCGFHQPSQNLVNFFHVDAATGLPIALTDPAWNTSSANFTGADNTTPIDPRLDWTIGRDGVPYKDWGPHQPGWIRSPAYGGVYSPKKNVHEKTSGAQSTVGWTNTQLNSVNTHIFRYADLLLLLAEAEVEAGVVENARTIVNQIRARAAVKVQGAGCSPALTVSCTSDRVLLAVPINDPSITWANYQVGQYPPFANQAAARTAVRFERRLELAMEGQRFFDLRRWGIADVVLNAYLDNMAGGSEKARRSQLKSAETFIAKHYLFPIPDIQIQLSTVGGTSTLKQNTGW